MKQYAIPFPSAADVGAARARARSLAPAGVVHDLAAIFAELNERFFGNAVKSQITWGRGRTKAASRRRRKSRHITLGSFSRRHSLITIHPNLDRPDVPRFFVESIVFHEMCHEVVGEERRDGRRLIHTPRFHEQERRYPQFAEARAWARGNIGYLLGNDPAPKRERDHFAPTMTNEQASTSAPPSS